MIKQESEILVPSPEINWGKNTYAPNGDLVDRKPGLTRVLTGGIIYILQEDWDGSNYHLTTLTKDTTNSKIFYGYPGSFPLGWTLAAADRPFQFDNPDRINAALECMKKLADTDQTRINSLQIAHIGTTYLNSLRQFLGQANPEKLRRIAVLEEEVQSLTSAHFNESFLQVADKMEELGLVEMELANMELGAREPFFNVTPNWLRRVYGQQAA